MKNNYKCAEIIIMMMVIPGSFIACSPYKLINNLLKKADM